MSTSMNVRRSIVGVVGSGQEAWEDRALELGCWLATLGVHLLSGGGAGVMATVSRGFFESSERKGLVIGILPYGLDCEGAKPKTGYPNPWIEIPILTHLTLTGVHGMSPLSRNHIVVLSSDVLVVLPGGAGTVSEARLAIRYGRPVIAYLHDPHEISGLPEKIPMASSLDKVQEFVLSHIHI